MSGFKKPTGFFGQILARGMAWGHKDFYNNTARVLDLTHFDKYLEIGFGSGLFIKKYASHVEKISGITEFIITIKIRSRKQRGYSYTRKEYYQKNKDKVS